MALTVEVEIDDARELLYEELTADLSEATIQNTLEGVANNQITELFNNRDELMEQQQRTDELRQ